MLDDIFSGRDLERTLGHGMQAAAAEMLHELEESMADQQRAMQHVFGHHGPDASAPGRGAIAPRQDGDAPSVPYQPRAQGGAAPRTELTPEEAKRAALLRKAESLRRDGALVYLPGENKELTWDSMAGYEAQKLEVEDLVLMSVTHAAEYAEMAKRTRRSGTSRRPKARAAAFAAP